MSMYQSTYQFQGVQGPTDPALTHNAVEGYQPVSRIGEVVINAFGTPRFIQASSPLLSRISLK